MFENVGPIFIRLKRASSTIIALRCLKEAKCFYFYYFKTGNSFSPSSLCKTGLRERRGSKNPSTQLSIDNLQFTALISSQVVPVPCQLLLVITSLHSMQCVKLLLLSGQEISGLTTTNPRLLGKAWSTWPRKEIAKVFSKSHRTCI